MMLLLRGPVVVLYTDCWRRNTKLAGQSNLRPASISSHILLERPSLYL